MVIFHCYVSSPEDTRNHPKIMEQIEISPSHWVTDINWLVVTGTWLDYDFPSIGNVIIPTDEVIFFRGVGWNHQSLGRWFLKLTNDLDDVLDWRETSSPEISRSIGEAGFPETQFGKFGREDFTGNIDLTTENWWNHNCPRVGTNTA